MSTQTANRIPAPLYAVAGAGDLALRQLRKLPAKATELRTRVAANDLDLNIDVDELRALAKRNVKALNTYAHAAQERVLAVYSDLVAHGERVVGGRDGAAGSVAAIDEMAAPATATKAKRVVTEAVPAAKANGAAPAPRKRTAAKK